MNEIVNFLTSPTGTVLAVFATIASALAASIAAYFAYHQVRVGKRQAELAEFQLALQRSKFPFDSFNVNALLKTEVIQRLQNFTVTDAQIRYIQRLPTEHYQQEFNKWKDSHYKSQPVSPRQ